MVIEYCEQNAVPSLRICEKRDWDYLGLTNDRDSDAEDEGGIGDANE